MEHKKIIKFTVSIVVLMVVFMFTTLSDLIPYPYKTYMIVIWGIVMLGLTAKLIYDFFNADQRIPSISNYSTSGREVFFISTYRTTTLSLIMILLPVFLIYIVVELLPEMMSEIQKNFSVAVTVMLVLYLILFFASLYSLFEGVKLFIRRKKIVQLIIDDDHFEFFPIYDFGTTKRSTNVLSMFFRKKMQKAYFTNQLAIEMISNKWLGNKIKIYIEGISFYLPYLYNDTNELERVYQTIKQRLQKKT